MLCDGVCLCVCTHTCVKAKIPSTRSSSRPEMTLKGTIRSRSALVSHSWALAEDEAAAAAELESPPMGGRYRVTLSSMKLSQCGSITNHLSARRGWMNGRDHE